MFKIKKKDVILHTIPNMNIEIEDIVRAAAPSLAVLALEYEIANCPTSDALWAEVEAAAADIRARFAIDQINKRPAIAATRAAYKALGKEPNRYRPAAEALCRRAVKGAGLYRVNAAVDIINILSMLSGYSIGGFDIDRIDGPVLRLGRGQCGEPYQGIGRGDLNIEGLPVYRDATGGIGTPTSDHERTKITESTRRLLVLTNIYGPEMPADEYEALATRLLSTYCHAHLISKFYT